MMAAANYTNHMLRLFYEHPPTRVDDFHPTPNNFGGWHLRRKQVVSKGGRIFCTEDEAKQVVARIAPAVREAFGRAADGTEATSKRA